MNRFHRQLTTACRERVAVIARRLGGEIALAPKGGFLVESMPPGWTLEMLIVEAQKELASDPKRRSR